MENVSEKIGEYIHLIPDAVTYYRNPSKSSLEVDQEVSLMFRIKDQAFKNEILTYIKTENPLDTPEILVTPLVE